MLERKVQQRTLQLEVANQAKSRFLAAASHDLRQPLHALGLFIGQMHGRMRASQRVRLLTRITAALGAMNELFNAVLDISKLDAGALTPAITTFPLDRLLNRVETTFAESAHEKGLIFRIVYCGAWVRSDFILLERILFNLVANAIRYTNRGKVIIGCRRHEANLRIEVWDTGPGIPANERERVFGEFYRLEDSERDGKGGLGLGLAIVDRLCRLLDHRLTLRSQFDRGSCFSILVPIADAARQAPTLPEVRAFTAVANGRTVIVIDDDALVRDGMGGLLRSWGYRVLTAGTGSAAVARFAKSKEKPDLIISDYHLADGKTGIEVIDGLRRFFADRSPRFSSVATPMANACVRRGLAAISCCLSRLTQWRCVPPWRRL